MDDTRFDTLTRTLTAAGSRRRALALMLTSALAPLLAGEAAEAHNPTKACRKKSGKQKKKCLKKAKTHNATHAVPPVPSAPACTPSCSGKECGSDGCGGTCGDCGQLQFCINGTCEAICLPNCQGKVCGPNGCGGACGDCGRLLTCSADGTACVFFA